MKPRDEDYMHHILGAISSIEAYTAEGETAFMVDRKTQDAVIRNLEIIGEAAGNWGQTTVSRFRNRGLSPFFRAPQLDRNTP
ncbi:MAG: hypothetical protein A2V78_13890 [Betaproteobacteria bacterium RBG_16_64_18]|nr:MAG: hypothetical protein A2V78_13890 [Betaproteobacteria bacterium RBG_16_64_18]